MRDFGREARKATEEKIKYGQKVLTNEGIANIFTSFISVFDIYSFLSDLVISNTFFSSFVSNFLLGFSLNDILPDNLEFQIDLPNMDQLLNGVQLVLQQINLQISLQNILQSLTNLNIQINLSDLTTLTQFINPTVQFNSLNKAYYNESYYGQSYYDPTAVSQFFKSTLYAMTKKKSNPATQRAELSAIATSLNIKPELVGDLYNRMTAMSAVEQQCATWDYAFWDYSDLCPEEENNPKEGLVTIQTYDGNSLTLEYRNMIDFQAGCYWDDSLWDYCFWLDYDETGDNIYNSDGANINLLHDAVYRNFKNRINSTAIALANYQTPEQRMDPHNSPRVAQFGFASVKNKQLMYLTQQIVRQLVPNVNAFTLNLYSSAVLNLYGVLYNPHKWGNEAQRSMSEQQLKTWWVTKWTNEGLDSNVLNTLFDRLITVIRAQGQYRQQRRINFMNWMLKGS